MSSCRVAVIGAGFGGIGMGVALKRAGFEDFVIFEKGADVGGVWRDNTYPGCRCDVPSHLYSFSFAPYRDRRIRYPGQRQILEYLHRVAVECDVMSHLRLGAAVTEATYLERRGCWELTTAVGRSVADVVVFAVGQLHRPYLPDIEGRNDFAGVSFHTSEWDHRHDLEGRDIAVIGTGSSAAQILPSLAATAARVRLFQRTPHWVLPKPPVEFGPLARAGLSLPGAHHLYRQALENGADAVLAPIMRRGWSARPAAWLARRYLHRQVPDPALRAKLTPDYPIGGKRIIFDSHYYSTLNRPNVELVTEPVAGIVRDGVVTADGTRHRVDVIVYATGFRAPEFLVPVQVRGRGGTVLQEHWSTGASAFFGLAVPGYPNAFLIAGPNSFNPAGSNPGMKERQIEYILECLRLRERLGVAAIEVDEEAMRAHRRWLDQAIDKTVWPATGPSWYKDHAGRITNPWPASARTYERMLRQHRPEACFRAASADTPYPRHGRSAHAVTRCSTTAASPAAS